MKRLFGKIKAFINRLNNEKGIALLLVVVIIAIMLPIVTDLNYEAKTEFEIAMNHKKKAEAMALAHSSVSFAAVVFDLQKQLENAMKNFGIKQSFEIWDIIPFDTALMRSFTDAGPFASLQDIKETKNADGETQPEKNNTGGKTGSGSGSAPSAFEGDSLFDFPGDFKLEFQNEEKKININLIETGAKDSIVKMLQGIIEPEIYDFIFLENTSRKEYVTREDLIANIVDWIDGNNEKHGTGGDEGSQYEKFTPRYKIKNARLDTIDELRMVYGVDDIVFRLLSPYITIYSNGKININKASPEMLEALIRSYARDKSMTIFYNEDMMRELMGKILAKKAKDGFEKAESFIAAVKEEGVELDGAISSVIDSKGRYYRIKAVGTMGEVESWVEMVVDLDGNILFYKEE